MNSEPRSANRCYQRLKAIRQQKIPKDDKIEPCVEPGSGWKGGRPIACCRSPVIIFFKGRRPAYRSTEFTRARNWFASHSHFDDLAKTHPCPEPLDQCEELVKSFTCEGALVGDFVAGVGSIPIACAINNRRYLGVELDPQYVSIARKRLKARTKK